MARRATILLVEDEALISDFVADALCESGFAVHAEADAEAALRYLESGAEVDVLFTDINLAGSMDGSVLAKKARMQRPDLPIVYCSGRYTPADLALPVSRSVFLRKPYDPADLAVLLTRLTADAAH
jgi:CheY-like chemotaxis protein